ncbi:hypothetical protein Sfulv_51140 [Streptomyces fulvorobeus]|uniref:Uncharacterized protein n=1 Tax=Streptomyces fulvorobeus TaxID=284028 RepID=A0A7J0CEH7_9ACTN|nr:hypothetical protein Sfulv_51140 [Streptomyces fulvorobeus]
MPAEPQVGLDPQFQRPGPALLDAQDLGVQERPRRHVDECRALPQAERAAEQLGRAGGVPPLQRRAPSAVSRWKSTTSLLRTGSLSWYPPKRVLSTSLAWGRRASGRAALILRRSWRM